MNRKRSLAALALSLMLAAPLLAQSEQSEFGRTTAGEVYLITKNSRSLSGSLGLSSSLSNSLFGSRKGLGYAATLGGTLLRDRLWFFGSFDQAQPLITSQYGFNPDLRMATAKMDARLGNRQTLAASFVSTQPRGLTSDATFPAAIPSSFLSLRYTGVVSDSMTFNVSLSQRRQQ